jgi:hypothetical protein
VGIALRRRPEIQIAMSALLNDHLNKLKLDKLGSIFSFLVKSQYPISQEDMKALAKAFKRNLVECSTTINQSPVEAPATKVPESEDSMVETEVM